MGVQTKQGKALFAAFDPEQRDAITSPNAIRQVSKDKDGNPVPVDRTVDGVLYQSEADEQLVKE